jgi:hypothetical protein
MHNMMHNMVDDEMIANHIVMRRGVCQYVRRVPEDLRAEFPFARIQRSLGTQDKRKAREAALELDRNWERRFAEARIRKGVGSDDIGGIARIDTAQWTWSDWEALALWLKLTLANDDWQVRLTGAPGRLLGANADIKSLPWRDDETVKQHIARGRVLAKMTVGAYTSDCVGDVQAHIRRLGVIISRTDPHFDRFMAACMAAELAYLDIFKQREGRIGGLDQPHPETVPGPWRQARAEPATAVPPSPVVRHAKQTADTEITLAGKTLADCRAKWVENRNKVKKKVRPSHLREMDSVIAAFEVQAKVRDIGAIRRRHLLAFRDHLSSTTDYAAGTINKKIGFISSLLGTALNAGWTETSLGGSLFLEVPQDEGGREPYSNDELATIFASPTFTTGYRNKQVKACGEVQFWLPLISCVHGMISSEILQLGPDSFKPHPDAPQIWCMIVTNAGDRRIKTLARQRWVPIRKELLDLGLLKLVEAASSQQKRFIWQVLSEHGDDVEKVSGYFSSYWSRFSDRKLMIQTEGTSLYSFRHAFQDALAAAGWPEEVKKALMGHAESGMTGRYGTKKKPRVVDIIEMNEAIQSLKWAFIGNVKNLHG